MLLIENFAVGFGEIVTNVEVMKCVMVLLMLCSRNKID